MFYYLNKNTMTTIEGSPCYDKPEIRNQGFKPEWFNNEEEIGKILSPKFKEILDNEGIVARDKYNLIKDEPYAPETPDGLRLFLRDDETEIRRKIALAKKYKEKYGMQTIEFEDYYKYLWEPNEELREKLELLKRPYAPKFVLRIEELNKLSKEEIELRNKAVEELEKYGIKITDFCEFYYIMPKIYQELENNEELKNKLEEMNWRPDAPKSARDVIKLSLSLKNVSDEFLKFAHLYLADKEYKAKIARRLWWN